MTQSTSISARISTELPGPETPSTTASSPSGRTGTFIKKIDVRNDIALRHAVCSEFEEKVFAASVHVARLVAETDRIGFATAGAGNRVVQPARVGNDGREDVAVVREKFRACTDVGTSLPEQRLLRIVALGGIVPVVEERIDGLLSVEIDDAEDFATAHHVRPRRSGRDDAIVCGGRLRHTRRNPSVFWKARIASIVALRLRSSCRAGGERHTTASIVPAACCIGASG